MHKVHLLTFDNVRSLSALETGHEFYWRALRCKQDRITEQFSGHFNSVPWSRIFQTVLKICMSCKIFKRHSFREVFWIK